MADPKKLKMTAARILRRIDSYKEIVNKREERFSNLLKKSLTEDLNQVELDELENLQASRTAALNASEVPLLNELNKAIQKLEGLSSELMKKPTKRE